MRLFGCWSSRSLKRSRRRRRIGDNIFPLQSPPDHLGDYHPYLCLSVELSDVVPARKLVGVPPGVFGGYVVKGPVDSPPEQGPVAFDSVGVNPVPDVFPCTVLDAFVVGQVIVVGVFVSVDKSAMLGMGFDESCKRLFVGRGNRGHDNLIGRPVLCAQNGGLADCAPARPELLRSMFVGFFTSHVNFVNLYRALKRGGFRSQGFPYPMLQEPCRRLRYANVAVQLHGAYALQAGGHQVSSQGPLAEIEFTGFHHCPGLDAEILAAVPATEGSGFAGGPVLDVVAGAVGASDPVGPTGVNEHLLNFGFVGEAGNCFNQGHTLAVVFTWCFGLGLAHRCNSYHY